MCNCCALIWSLSYLLALVACDEWLALVCGECRVGEYGTNRCWKNSVCTLVQVK